MSLKKNLLISLMFVFLLNSFLFSQVTTEKKVADFTLPDLKGKNFQLKENLGEGVTLINFWATWCMPCRAEMKKLKNIYKKYNDKGLEIICISVDDPKTVSKVKSFIKTNRYIFKVLLDTNNEVMRLYQVTNPPYTLLLDKDGNIIYTHSGYRKGDEKLLAKKIENLLNQ